MEPNAGDAGRRLQERRIEGRREVDEINLGAAGGVAMCN